MKYLKKFETDLQRTQYEGGGEYVEPYVSLVEENNSVHYNKPYMCKLTLQDGSKVKLYDVNGDGVLTSAMTSSYKSTLVSAEIGNACTSISNEAFSGCTSLTSVTIPISVTSIGYSAFWGCSGLTSIIVDGGNTVYDSRNNCNAIIETASNTLIQGCKNTIIPNSVTKIGIYAFKDCSGLASVTIPNSVTSIGGGAFSYCSNLTSVNIPNSVTNIGYSAFWGCSGLTSIVIPNSVTSIDYNAFRDCSGLTSITSHAATAPTIQSSTFRNVKRRGKLYVPSGSSGYDVWMGTSNYYLGLYGWTKVEQ